MKTYTLINLSYLQSFLGVMYFQIPPDTKMARSEFLQEETLIIFWGLKSWERHT